MNGFDFEVRVLQPWVRDPAFYATVWTEQSDTPAHEGPTPAGIVDLWTYTFPLRAGRRGALAAELRPIPPSSNRRDAISPATRATSGRPAPPRCAARRRTSPPRDAGRGERRRAARRPSPPRSGDGELVGWLEAQAPAKTGPSGIGKETYTWNLRHVHLVPMSWEEEVDLLRRELARAHAALKLEEERNRALPPLLAAADDAEYQRRANLAVAKLIAFVRDRDFYPMRAYLDPALRAHLGALRARSRRATSSPSPCTTTR